MKNLQSVCIFALLIISVIVLWNYLVFPLSIINRMLALPSEDIFISLDMILKEGRIADVESLKYELFRDVLMSSAAFLAIGGVGTYAYLQKTLKEELNEELEEYKKRFEGLVSCQNQLTLVVHKQDKYQSKIEDLLFERKKIENMNVIPPWLNELIDQSRTAVKSAKESLNDRAILLAKNNLAYFLSIAKVDKRETLRLIDNVQKASKEHYHTKDWYHCKDTTIWANWRFATDENQKKEARSMFYELYKQREKILELGFKEKLSKAKTFFDSFS